MLTGRKHNPKPTDPTFAVFGEALEALQRLRAEGATYSVYHPAGADFNNLWFTPASKEIGPAARIPDIEFARDWRRFERWYSLATWRQSVLEACESIDSIEAVPLDQLPLGPARDHLLYLARTRHDVRAFLLDGETVYRVRYTTQTETPREEVYTFAEWAALHDEPLEYGPLKRLMVAESEVA